MNEHQLDPSEMEGLLDELRRRLDAAGIAARIHVFGGSAMALRFPDDSETRMTQDIDAAFQPREAVLGVIAAMAEERGLPPTWLNSSGSAFIPPGDRSEETATGVDFTVATVDELIAMKLAASREQDLHDLGILARNAGIADPERLVEIAFAAYGEDSMALTETRGDYLVMATQALAQAKKRASRSGGSRPAG